MKKWLAFLPLIWAHLGYAQEADTVRIKTYSSPAQDFFVKDTAKTTGEEVTTGPEDLNHFSYILTLEDIQRSAARDLFELLNSLPSLAFGVDVQGSLTVGIRGNAAGESTALVVDGLVLNEGMYGTYQLAGKFSLGQITRIEVYVGPNALKINNLAAYGVIIIKTQASTPFTGVSTGWNQGFNNPSKDARVSAHVSAGQIGALWSVAATASVNSSVLSFKNYTDNAGNTYNMETNSGIYNRFASFQARYKKSSITFVTDIYQLSQRDAFGLSTSQPYRSDFVSYGITLRHVEKLSSKVTVIGLLSFKSQDPYATRSEIASTDTGYYGKFWIRSQRAVAQTNLVYKPAKRFLLTFGANLSLDHGINLLRYTNFFENTNYKKDQRTRALIGQAVYSHKSTLLTLGAKYENNSDAGTYLGHSYSAYQEVGIFYGRASYSIAFRFPTMLNVDLKGEGQALKAMCVGTLDGEVGIKHKNFKAGVNFFNTTTKNAISYVTNSTGEESYKNSTSFTNNGVELFAAKKSDSFWFKLGYMMYGRDKTLPENTYSFSNSTSNIGLPNHKVIAHIGGHILPKLDFSFLGIFESVKHGLVSGSVLQDDTGNGINYLSRTFKKYPKQLTVNFFLHYRVAVANGIDVTMGIVDILDTKVQYVQPYSSDHLPLPGPSREYIFRVSYAITR